MIANIKTRVNREIDRLKHRKMLDLKLFHLKITLPDLQLNRVLPREAIRLWEPEREGTVKRPTGLRVPKGFEGRQPRRGQGSRRGQLGQGRCGRRTGDADNSHAAFPVAGGERVDRRVELALKERRNLDFLRH